ncbi:MAG TPA: hypothetical protein VGJ28_07245 [Micromonosporaceae bacterium]|jgi:hypothetical protein
MSEHDRGDTRGPAPSVSRRTLVKTAAGAGVAAATVGIVGAAHASGKPADTEAAVLAGAPLTAGSSANGPVVVHVLDAAAGKLEIFTNGDRTEVTNADLANRILRVAKD